MAASRSPDHFTRTPLAPGAIDPVLKVHVDARADLQDLEHYQPAPM
ncbi:hypothetical protein [Streptomyces sp. F001]|nr:hypothetical protein [Streptomyces sp. F001]